MNIENEEYASAVSELISLAISGRLEFVRLGVDSETVDQSVRYVLELARKVDIIKTLESVKE